MSNKTDTFVETRHMLVSRGYRNDVPCVVHLEFDVGTVIKWMAAQALRNKSGQCSYLNRALRVTVRHEGALSK